jgi:hypothetical protein
MCGGRGDEEGGRGKKGGGISEKGTEQKLYLGMEQECIRKTRTNCRSGSRGKASRSRNWIRIWIKTVLGKQGGSAGVGTMSMVDAMAQTQRLPAPTPR